MLSRAIKLKRKPFWTTQPCRPERCVNSYQQSKVSLVQLYITSVVQQHINGNQKLKQNASGRRGRVVEGSVSNATNKENANIEQLYIITSAVYQPLSANLKHIWRSSLSPARYISRDKAYLAQPYINSNHNTKQKHRWTTRPCRSARYINRHQQSNSIPGAAAYQQHGIQTAISKRNTIWRNCISTARSINRNQHRGIISGAAVYQQPSKA